MFLLQQLIIIVYDINNVFIQPLKSTGSKYIYDFNAKKYELASFVAHEDYNKVIPFENDIAVVFVKEPMKFSRVAKKGILVNHKKWMCSREKRFAVTGWGMIEVIQ